MSKKQASQNLGKQIHDLKKIEDDPDEVSGRYQLLLEHATDIISIHDSEGICTYISPSCYYFLGYTPEEIIKHGTYSLIHPDDIEAVKETHIKILNEEKIHTNEYRIRHKQGHFIWMETNSKSIQARENGQLQTILSITRNINKHKETEDVLRNSRRTWEKTFDAIADWVCIIDQDHNIKCSNRSIKKIFNLSSETCVGKQCYEITHGTKEPISDCPVTKAMKSGKRESIEFQIENDRWLQITVDPFRHNCTDKEQFVHIVRDITDMKHKEESLVLNSKAEAFRILSGGIAHDYNNLLTVIWGNISLLKEEMKEASQKKFFEAAEKACEQARYLTHQFITLSKCTMLNRSFVEISDVLKPALEQAGLKKQNKIKVISRTPEDIYVIEADSNLLTIAIKNIVINAMEAMPYGGQLDIDMEALSLSNEKQECQSYLKLSFTDTGKGIKKSDLSNVFDPYFTTKSMRVQKGMGLGLAVSKSIVQKNGGDIQIFSTPGQGTTAFIYLPLINLDPDVSSRKKLPPLTEKPVILFMEDDRALREMLEIMLRSLDYEAISAGHGKELIDIFEQMVQNNRKIDLILLDQNIAGGIGGIDTLKELRKEGFNNRAIVVTGSPNSPAIADFKKYGFDGSLLKPFTKRELEKVIRLYLPKSD